MRDPSPGPESARPRRSAPWGLVGMLALVAAAEWAVARGGLDFLDTDDWAYRKSAEAASKRAGGYDALCFGESLMKLGVVPRAVGERTGWRVYNLAVCGSQAPASAALLKRALDAGARPRAVVVDFAPMLLRVGPRHNLTRWAGLLGLGEAAELAWWSGDADLFGTVAAGRLLPSARAREGVRAHVVGALAGSGDVRRFANFQLFRNWGRNDGAQLLPASPEALRAFTPGQLDAFRRAFYPGFTVHPANLRGVEQFLALAESHKVPVFWVLTPLWPAIEEGLARDGYSARHEAFVRSWQARFPGLTVVDGRRAVSDPAGFFDPNHLSAAGAYAFSRSLGDALRRADGPPDRWRTTTACRVGPAPGWVEDTEQSRLAIEAITRGRGRW